MIVQFIFDNSLQNEFAFDDHLAIVNNKDTDPDKSAYYELWRHDLWGKGLREFDSHRSYHSFAKFTSSLISFYTDQDLVLIQSQSEQRVIGSSYLGLGSALLFSAHPVHVESVAAVVNMAEPLGCILYITGFLIYWYSSQRLSSSSSSLTNTNTNSSNTQYHMLTFILTLIAIALWSFAMVLSVLTKETGVTLAGVIVGTATAYLLERIGYTLLITATTDSTTVQSITTNTSKSASASSFLSRLRAIPSLFTHRKWIIDWSSGQLLWIACALLSVVGYTFMRMITATYDIVELFSEIKKTPYDNWSITNKINWINALLQQHQGSIGGSLYLGKSELIRKAENPFAFLTGTERMFSIAYLHFRYMFVMIYPKDLSAEYAFDCISKVSDIHDVRNIYTLMTYGSLLIGIGIGLVCVLFPRRQLSSPLPLSSSSSKYITLNPTAILIALIWLVVPFLPASGVSEVKS
eukprot:gene2741-5402_t